MRKINHLLTSSMMLLALSLGASDAFGQSVKACRNTTNGNLRQVSSAADCKPNEEYVTWSVTGPQGPAGAQGAQGAQGPAGPQGPQGAVGPQGPQGPQGQRGEKGDKGNAGEKGEQGERGEKGEKGEAGAVGAQGPRGLDGMQGPQGPQGAPGARGDKGDKGDTGPAGSPTLTLGAQYFGITVTNVRINGGGNQARVSPGAAFSLDFDFNNTQSWCPGCIVQIYVGLSSDPKPQVCASSVVAGATPGTTGHAAVTLTAPTTRGIYYIAIERDLQFFCFGGGQVWTSGAPSNRESYIGAIAVY